MLKLTYTRKSDQYQTVTVLGHPDGIRDLYWQLKNNYECKDGTKIGTITVSDLDGHDLTKQLLSSPRSSATRLSTLEP